MNKQERERLSQRKGIVSSSLCSVYALVWFQFKAGSSLVWVYRFILVSGHVVSASESFSRTRADINILVFIQAEANGVSKACSTLGF